MRRRKLLNVLNLQLCALSSFFFDQRQVDGTYLNGRIDVDKNREYRLEGVSANFLEHWQKEFRVPKADGIEMTQN